MKNISTQSCILLFFFQDNVLLLNDISFNDTLFDEISFLAYETLHAFCTNEMMAHTYLPYSKTFSIHHSDGTVHDQFFIRNVQINQKKISETDRHIQPKKSIDFSYSRQPKCHTKKNRKKTLQNNLLQLKKPTQSNRYQHASSLRHIYDQRQRIIPFSQILPSKKRIKIKKTSPIFTSNLPHKKTCQDHLQKTYIHSFISKLQTKKTTLNHTKTIPLKKTKQIPQQQEKKTKAIFSSFLDKLRKNSFDKAKKYSPKKDSPKKLPEKEIEVNKKKSNENPKERPPINQIFLLQPTLTTPMYKNGSIIPFFPKKKKKLVIRKKDDGCIKKTFYQNRSKKWLTYILIMAFIIMSIVTMQSKRQSLPLETCHKFILEQKQEDVPPALHELRSNELKEQQEQDY